MILDWLGNCKKVRQLKAVYNGDVVPEGWECPGFPLPEEVDAKDVMKKLLRYYYITEQGVPTGKVETSPDIPEMQHEYVLPIRVKIGEAIAKCRMQMRQEIRKTSFEADLMSLIFLFAIAGFSLACLKFTGAGKIIVIACVVLGLALTAKMGLSSSRKP